MTLNELRDQLAKEHPGRSINAEANCWFHPHYPGVAETRQTTFVACIFKLGRATGIECRETAARPEDLLAKVRAAMAAPDDQVAIAEPEPELAT